MKRSLLIFGALFGLLAPFLGLFIGLQVSPALGTILIFPFILASGIFDIPVGHFSAPVWAALIVVSSICWAIIFAAFGLLWKNRPRKTTRKRS